MRFNRGWDFSKGNRPLDLNSLTQDADVRAALQDALALAVFDSVDATLVDYDNAGSGLSGTQLQSAVDELAGLLADLTLATAQHLNAEQVRDEMGSTLVAGANVTLTVNDVGDTITISSTGGGGGGGGGGLTDEEVRDLMGVALVAGANVTITVDDVGNTITIASSDTNTTDVEVVRDTMAAALVAGTNITISVDDGGDTITINASVDQASEVGYSNGASGMVATDVQAALDELDGRVDSAATRTRTVNAQTASYTAVLADAGAFVTISTAGSSTFTIPPNSSVAFPVGTVIEGCQLGAGQVTLTPGAGVTINAVPGLKTAAQYSTFGLIKLATNTWLAYGRLAA
jgi:hypothetical protein